MILVGKYVILGISFKNFSLGSSRLKEDRWMGSNTDCLKASSEDKSNWMMVQIKSTFHDYLDYQINSVQDLGYGFCH